MDGRELEALFERFRTRGDVAALGAVFDRTAPELSKLARHLAPDAAAAEDLVQATFLAAIEDAQRFDASRELVPWLVGILTNKAKLARALRSREIDPSRLNERGDPDPALDAELRELAAALERALARLPAKYREVLQRNLLRGERPEEIARALRREPGAVRVQLHRGLARLRRLLPAGLALGLGVPIGPRGLDAIRTSVLRHASIAARGAGVLSSSFVVGGVVVSTKSVAAVVVAVAVVAGGTWWISRERAAEPESAVIEAASHEPRSEPVEAEPAPEAPSDAERSAVADSTARSSESEPFGALAIEVVWHDGTPAAGVELECTPRGESQPYNHVEALVTDADGHATLARVREGDVRIEVDRVGPTGNYTAAVQRGVTVTSRIEVPRGVDVRGRVLDPEHNPVAGARVWLGFGPRFPAPPAFEVARAGDDGRFVIRSARELASVIATAEGHAPAIETRIQDLALAADGSYEGELVLRVGGSSLEGIVTDAGGAPLSGALVALLPPIQAISPQDERLPWLRTRSDDGGGYRFSGLSSGHARVVAFANGFAHAGIAVTLEPAGTTRADLVLGRGTSLSGTVTDDRGDFVVGAHVRVEPAGDPLLWKDLRTEATTSDARGRYRLEAIARGTFAVIATRPGDQRQVIAAFQGEEGAVLTWDVVFDDGRTIAGRAEDPTGAPLVGWTVRASLQTPIGLTSPRSVVTDADGKFLLTNLLRDLHEVWLFAPGDQDQWLARTDFVEPPIDGVRLVADPSGALTSFVAGRVVDARGAAVGGISITIRDDEGRDWVAKSDATDGHFRVGPTASGNLVLTMRPTGRRTIAVQCRDVASRETRDVGDVVVPDTSSVELDIRRTDGASLERPWVRLVDSNGWSSILKSEDGIAFRSTEPIYEGHYRVFPVAANVATVVSEIEVRAGETARAEVRLPIGVQKFVTVRPAREEQRFGEVHVVVRDASGNVVLEDVTELASPNREGNVTGLNAGFAFGRYTLEVTAPDGRRATLDFEVKPDDEPYKALTLDFPAG